MIRHLRGDSIDVYSCSALTSKRFPYTIRRTCRLTPGTASQRHSRIPMLLRRPLRSDGWSRSGHVAACEHALHARCTYRTAVNRSYFMSSLLVPQCAVAVCTNLLRWYHTDDSARSASARKPDFTLRGGRFVTILPRRSVFFSFRSPVL